MTLVYKTTRQPKHEKHVCLKSKLNPHELTGQDVTYSVLKESNLFYGLTFDLGQGDLTREGDISVDMHRLDIIIII